MNLDNLPSVDQALNLKLFDKIAPIIIQKQDVCKHYLTTPQKLREWCFYLNCHVGIMNCKLPHTGGDNTTVAPVLKCFDDYQCDLEYLAKFYSSILGWTTLFFAISGIVANCFAIPTFTVASIASATTLYLIGIATSDIGYLLMNLFIVVPHHLPLSYISQQEKYITFTAHIIPYVAPLMEMFESIGVWFVLYLLIDRLFYIKMGHRSKLVLTKNKASVILSASATILAIYTIPKMFYFSKQKYKNGFKVVISKFGNDYKETFMNLKIPIEMMIPYIAIFILATYNTIEMIRTHSIRQKKMNAVDEASLTPRQLIELRENATVTCTICLAYFLLMTKTPKMFREAFVIQEVYNREQLQILDIIVSFTNTLLTFGKPFFCLYIGYYFRNAIFAMFCCREQSDMTQKIVDLDFKGNLPFVFSNSNSANLWVEFMNNKNFKINENYYRDASE